MSLLLHLRAGHVRNTFRHVIPAALVAALACVCPASLLAQDVEQVATLPPNMVLGNYDSVPVGPFGGLESSAYGARVSDPSAAWFNPAGLSRQNTAQISGSAGVYERISVSPNSLPNKGGSFQQLPNFVGFTFNIRDGLTAGATVLTTTAWAQQTDSQLILARPGGEERFGFSADSEFTRRVLAFGAGYHGGGNWRVGGGLAFSMMDLRLVQTVSDRIGDAGGLSTLLVTAGANGNSVQLRTQGGAQYDTTHFRFGAAVRSPGLTLFDSGGVTLDGTLNRAASSLGASIFAPDAELEYHLPWEFQAGAAYVVDRFELEFDLHAYTSIDAYELLSTPNPTSIYASAGAGVPPTVSSRPFRGVTSASDGVVNGAIGGHYRVLHDRDFRVHGGFATGNSPVGPADQLFTKVDLTSWTIGVSGTVARFQFAAGFNKRSGRSDETLVRNLLNGEPVKTTFDVSTAGFIYSIGFQF